MEIIIWGTGKGAEDIIPCLKKENMVIAYVDNDQTKWGNKFHDCFVIAPKELINMQFDYLIIAVAVNYECIVEQLKGVSVERNKIITPYSFDHTKYSEWRKQIGRAHV